MVLYEYLIEIIDIRLLDFLIFIFLLTFVYLFMIVFKIPFFIDPFGEKSTLLVNNPDAKNYSKKWRLEKIEEVIQTKDSKELLAVVGEFGKGMRDTVKDALEADFSVEVISGNILFTDSKEEIKRLIEKKSNFDLYMCKKRPIHHFAIIGHNNLFLEVPHSHAQKDKQSIGINNAYNNEFSEKLNYFNQLKKQCIKVDIENFDEIINGKLCWV